MLYVINYGTRCLKTKACANIELTKELVNELNNNGLDFFVINVAEKNYLTGYGFSSQPNASVIHLISSYTEEATSEVENILKAIGLRRSL